MNDRKDCIFLLDEPAADLGPDQQLTVHQIIHKLAAEHQLIYATSTSDLLDASDYPFLRLAAMEAKERGTKIQENVTLTDIAPYIRPS